MNVFLLHNLSDPHPPVRDQQTEGKQTESEQPGRVSAGEAMIPGVCGRFFGFCAGCQVALVYSYSIELGDEDEVENEAVRGSGWERVESEEVFDAPGEGLPSEMGSFLEQVFLENQALDGSSRNAVLGVRSLSVGDVVGLGAGPSPTRFFLVAALGFREVCVRDTQITHLDYPVPILPAQGFSSPER